MTNIFLENYQITEKEDSSDKESFCGSSMESLCMDDTGRKYKDQKENRIRRRPGTGNCRIAVAGLTGALLCAGAGGDVYAAQETVPCTMEKSGICRETANSPSAGREDIWWRDGERESDAQDSQNREDSGQSAADWDEDRILERWDLDPDSFPADRQEQKADIPDEYLPYFQEAASEAVAWYAGDRPPRTDLSGYSARADAIRQAAAAKAVESLQEERGELVDMAEQIFASTGSGSGQKLVSALQEDVFARPVHTYTLSSGADSLGPDGGGVDLMTLGKPRNDRADGDFSVSWFLQDHAMPIPPGLDPGTESSKTGRDLEEAAAEDQRLEDDEYEYAEHSLDEDEEDLQEEEKESEDRIEVGEGFIPLRDYGSTDRSADFFGQRRKVFIGDSRTVGMEMSCGGMPEEYWSAEVAMGYNWMVSTGVPDVENLIGPDTDVVILMGVNDLGNVYRYVDYINMKAAEWKKLGARTFFVSVTPVDDRRSPNAKNSRIESFNAYALENFRDVYYIDAYNRIRYSYGSPDGIHYDSATYREIYRIIEFSLYQGWYEQDGLWFYFDRGRPLTGWQYLDGQWQYMDGYGVRWIRDGRVGDRICLPLPDFTLTNDQVVSPVF